MFVKFPVTEMPVLGGFVAGKTETVKRVEAFGATVAGLAAPFARSVVPLPPQGLRRSACIARCARI